MPKVSAASADKTMILLSVTDPSKGCIHASRIMHASPGRNAANSCSILVLSCGGRGGQGVRDEDSAGLG